MGLQIIVRDDATLSEIVKELKVKLKDTDSVTAVCEVDEYLLEITIIRKDDLSEYN